MDDGPYLAAGRVQPTSDEDKQPPAGYGNPDGRTIAPDTDRGQKHGDACAGKIHAHS